MRVKKIIVAFMVFSILLTTGAVSSLAAATGGIKIYAEEIDAYSGQSFTVPIMISGNMGVSAIGINLTYDQEKLIPISAKKGSVLSSGMTDNSIGVSKEPKFNILWYSTKNVTTDGVIFNVEFLAKSGVSGKTIVNLEIDEDNTFDADYNLPNVSATDFTVNIIGSGEENTVPEVTKPVPDEGEMVFYSDTNCGIYNREAEIPIRIKNNNGLMGFKLDFIYDSSVIEIKDVVSSALTENGSLYYKNSADTLSVLWNSSEEFDTDGVIFTLLVKYKQPIKTDISMICSEDDTFDENYKNVNTICENLNILVRRMGDTDLSGDISISDVTAIQMHLAKIDMFDDEFLPLADCDSDGEITVSDVTKLQMVLAKYFTLD